MSEAMARLNNNTDDTTSIPKADILEYLAFSVFKQGTYKNNGKPNETKRNVHIATKIQFMENGEKSPKVNPRSKNARAKMTQSHIRKL